MEELSCHMGLDAYCTSEMQYRLAVSDSTTNGLR